MAQEDQDRQLLKLEQEIRQLLRDSRAHLERMEALSQDLNQLKVRMSTVENLDTPYQRAVRAQIDKMELRVDTLREKGTDIKLDNVAADVEEIKEEQRGTRVLVRSALITAATAIAVQLILFAILKAKL